MPRTIIRRSLRASAGLVLVGIGLGATAEQTGSWELEPGCVFASADTITAKMASLSAALAAGDPEAAAAHYSSDAIVMDVSETSIRLGQAEIVALYAQPAKVPAIETLTQTIANGCGQATVTGTQRYRWRTPASTAIVRFRIVFAGFGERWLIIHHHADLGEVEDLSASTIAAEVVPEPKPPAPPLATGSLTTGSIDGPRPADIALPPEAFRLPAQPPVFIATERPELLSAPRPRATTPLASQPPADPIVPTLPFAPPNAMLPAALQPRPQAPVQTAQPMPAETRVPVLPMVMTLPPITAALWASAAPPAAAAPVSVVVPPLPVTIGAFPSLTSARPVAPAGVASDVKPAAATALPSHEPTPPKSPPTAPAAKRAPEKEVAPASAKSATRAPEVASFAKRMEPSRPPVAAAKTPPIAQKPQRPPAQQAAQQPAPAYPAYRPGRWVYDKPVFGDD